MNENKGRRHFEKRRNCLLQTISPFLTMFSTAINQNAALCGQRLNSSKGQNIQMVQIQSICRRQNNSDSKKIISIGKSRELC